MGYAAKQIADAYDRVVAEVMVSLFNDRPVGSLNTGKR
jgi:hypothetical protein